MKKNLALMVGLLLASGVFAQFRKCATHEVDSMHKAQDAFYAERRFAIEEYTREFVAIQGISGGERAVITIPVVFHVVYQDATENISDAAIQSQIQVLNEDFRKLNSNFNQTPIVFRGVAADMEFEFCLATVDPQGLATTGITRTQTNDGSFTTDDQVKFTAQGGKNAWPRNKYLNIWVCDLGTSLLGYAEFPGGAANTDGVVIKYTTVGKPPANVFPGAYNKGRTATHEVGHWMNLYHIWGDDNGACTGTDQVEDTPNSDDENFGCPSFPRITCSNGPNGDMFMNFMDYMDDACGTMFTAGQKTRARALFSAGGARASLVTSIVCSSTPITQNPCSDTLRFPLGGTKVVYGDQQTGFVAGTNTYRDSVKADKFTVVSPYSRITGALFKFAVAQVNNVQNHQVTFRLYDDNGAAGMAGTILATQTVPLSTITQNVANSDYTTVQFGTPVQLTGSFYIGVVINPSSGVTLALFTNSDGDSNPNTAFEQFSDGSWHAYTETPASWGLSVSNEIHAIMDLPDPAASFTVTNNTICKGTQVTYTSTSTGAVSYEWSFNGGSPSSSTDPNPVVTYNTTGTFSTSLTVTGGCETQSDTQTEPGFIAVVAVPNTPVIQNSNGILISSVATGTFQWFLNNAIISGVSGSTFTPTQPGNYTVSVTQNGCSRTSPVFLLQTVGIQHVGNPTFARVFPNPATEEITIQTGLNTGNGVVSVSLIDLSGKCLINKLFLSVKQGESFQLNVDEISSGIYLLEISLLGQVQHERIAIAK